jgi:hypothetical protein
MKQTDIEFVYNENGKPCCLGYGSSGEVRLLPVYKYFGFHLERGVSRIVVRAELRISYTPAKPDAEGYAIKTCLLPWEAGISRHVPWRPV